MLECCATISYRLGNILSKKRAGEKHRGKNSKEEKKKRVFDKDCKKAISGEGFGDLHHQKT